MANLTGRNHPRQVFAGKSINIIHPLSPTMEITSSFESEWNQRRRVRPPKWLVVKTREDPPFASYFPMWKKVLSV